MPLRAAAKYTSSIGCFLKKFRRLIAAEDLITARRRVHIPAFLNFSKDGRPHHTAMPRNKDVFLFTIRLMTLLVGSGAALRAHRLDIL